MKDTYIPLSIAFLDESGRIVNLQNMTPMQTEKRYFSSRPVKYALEVNQGWFDTHEVEIGDTVEMKLPIGINIQQHLLSRHGYFTFRPAVSVTRPIGNGNDPQVPIGLRSLQERVGKPTMRKDNVIKLKKTDVFVDDPLTDILCQGARKLLIQALEA